MFLLTKLSNFPWPWTQCPENLQYNFIHVLSCKMSPFSKLLTRAVTRREWAWLWRPRPWTARPTPSSSGSWPRSSGSGSLTSAWTVEPGPGTRSVFFSVWWIRIRRSVPLTNGSGSGSSYFRQWPTRRIIFLLLRLFAYYFLKLHLHLFSKIKSHKEVTKQ